MQMEVEVTRVVNKLRKSPNRETLTSSCAAALRKRARGTGVPRATRFRNRLQISPVLNRIIQALLLLHLDHLDSSRLADKMRALKVVSFGKAEIVSDAPVPALRPEYILVRTVAIALNPTDWKSIQRADKNITIGCDYAGIVQEVGGKVTKPFKREIVLRGLSSEPMLLSLKMVQMQSIWSPKVICRSKFPAT